MSNPPPFKADCQGRVHCIWNFYSSPHLQTSKSSFPRWEGRMDSRLLNCTCGHINHRGCNPGSIQTSSGPGFHPCSLRNQFPVKGGCFFSSLLVFKLLPLPSLFFLLGCESPSATELVVGTVSDAGISVLATQFWLRREASH